MFCSATTSAPKDVMKATCEAVGVRRGVTAFLRAVEHIINAANESGQFRDPFTAAFWITGIRDIISRFGTCDDSAVEALTLVAQMVSKVESEALRADILARFQHLVWPLIEQHLLPASIKPLFDLAGSYCSVQTRIGGAATRCSNCGSDRVEHACGTCNAYAFCSVECCDAVAVQHFAVCHDAASATESDLREHLIEALVDMEMGKRLAPPTFHALTRA